MTQSNHSKITLFAAKCLAIAAVMLMAVFLHRLSEFSSSCYSSRIIDRLVLFSEQIEIPNCRRALLDLPLNNRRLGGQNAVWNRWIAQLEKIREFWPSERQKISVLQVDQDPFAFKQEGHNLIMGGEWGRSQRMWSNLVISTWLKRVGFGLSDLENAVLSEFLVSVALGEHRLEGVDRSHLSEEEITWAGLAQSTTDYCVSVWRWPEEFDHCEAGQGENLRPLLTRGLWLIYRQADWRGQRRLLTWLTRSVASGRESLLLASPQTPDSPEWMRSELGRWARKAGHRYPDFYLTGIELRLGLRQAQNPPVAVYAEPPANLKMVKGETLAFLNGNGVTWAGHQTLNATPEVELWPKNLVKIICKKPRRLQSLARQAGETVLVVMACDPSGLKGWRYLAQARLKSFVAANPGVPMIWLNAAGLRKASKRLRLGSAPLSLTRLRSISHWQEDRWDQNSQSFIPRAALDLVLLHRASRELL